MTKKFLFGTLAIALAFGMMVTGCNNADEDGFENHTINLTSAGENNAILLTLKGATWDPTLKLDLDDPVNAAKQKVFQEVLLERLLEWNQLSGNIPDLKIIHIKSAFKLEKDNVIKITFSGVDFLGSNGYVGSGEVTIKDYSAPELLAVLELVTEDMDQLAYWTIGTNNPVNIAIK